MGIVEQFLKVCGFVCLVGFPVRVVGVGGVASCKVKVAQMQVPILIQLRLVGSSSCSAAD